MIGITGHKIRTWRIYYIPMKYGEKYYHGGYIAIDRYYRESKFPRGTANISTRMIADLMCSGRNRRWLNARDI